MIVRNYRKLKKRKLWNMKLTVIPIVTGAHGTVTKRLVQGLNDLEIRGRLETNQTIALLGSASILRRVLEMWGDVLSHRLLWNIVRYHWSDKLSKEYSNYYNHTKYIPRLFFPFVSFPASFNWWFFTEV